MSLESQEVTLMIAQAGCGTEQALAVRGDDARVERVV